MDPNQNTPPPNPYAAPQARVQDPTPGEGELASRWLRLGGAIIDAIILIVVLLPFIFMFGLGAAMMGEGGAGYGTQVAGTVLGFVLFVAVQGYFLNQSGQTIAKKLLKMKIVDENGQKPEFVKLIGLRYATIQFVQLIPFLGTILALVDALFIFRDDRRRIVDLIAGTRVVMAE
jgi:uncharacterized RDD family membrane protein YckC